MENLRRKMKTPTLKEKVAQYEAFLNKINMFIVSSNNDGIKELVENADKWSYSHRNGEFVTDRQRQKMINSQFWKLCDTPNADRETKERQKAFEEVKKFKEKSLKRL